MGETCKPFFFLTYSNLDGGSFDSSGFLAEGILIFASAVPQEKEE